MNRQNELIAALSRDLKPVNALPNLNVLAVIWLLASAGFVVAMTHLVAPIRPGSFGQLISNPRFLVESLLGLLAIAWIGLTAFRESIPAALTRPFAVIGCILMILWLAQYVIGLISPALEPSILGKRAHCLEETMIYALPPIVAAVMIMRRLYPLRFVRTAMIFGLAAGMLPALYMQFACMYEAKHILSFHVLPGLAMVLVAGAIAAVWKHRVESFRNFR